MTSIALVIGALVVSFLAARRSLVAGLSVVLTIGYAYGIVRANQLDGYSHLLFDAALLGLYAARLFTAATAADRARVDELRTWMLVLIGWPVLLFLVPRQDVLVELVGLRGNVFMLPCLLLGARLSRDEMYAFAGWLAILNLAAAGVAAAQFAVGIEPFFPRNPVTEIIYRSGDIAGFTAHRIPSTFTSAHAYAGTMVTSMPILIGAWMQPTRARWVRWLFTAAIGVSALAVFTTGARLPVVLLLLVAGAAMLSGRVHIGHKLRWVLVAAIVAWTVSGQERLQRFLTLQDTDYVTERIAGSVDLNFFELARAYPLGNGLGGGGTSIPYFLQSRIRNSVTMENEYARIVLEQGIPGLCAWILFLAWLFTRQHPGYPTWALSRRLMRVGAAASFASGMLGIGLLTSIPGTVLLLLSAGWMAVPERIPETVPTRRRTSTASLRWQYGPQ